MWVVDLIEYEDGRKIWVEPVDAKEDFTVREIENVLKFYRFDFLNATEAWEYYTDVTRSCCMVSGYDLLQAQFNELAKLLSILDTRIDGATPNKALISRRDMYLKELHELNEDLKRMEAKQCTN